MITCYHGHDLPGNHQKEGFEKRGENAAASTAQIEDAGERSGLDRAGIAGLAELQQALAG